MQIASALGGLMDAAVTLFGSGCTVELLFESTRESGRRFWTCSVVDPSLTSSAPGVRPIPRSSQFPLARCDSRCGGTASIRQWSTPVESCSASRLR
jgi:hypothetical protein